jgi:integrin beta 3
MPFTYFEFVDLTSNDIEKCTGTGCSGYSGKQTLTRNGHTCQDWSSDTPHAHDLNSYTGNTCRSASNNIVGIWCYTTQTGEFWRFDYCDPIYYKYLFKKCTTALPLVATTENVEW